MPGEDFVRFVLEAAKTGYPQSERVDLVWGVMEAVDPPSVRLEKEPEMLLNEIFLKLSPLCYEKRRTIPEWHTNSAGHHSHSHSIPPHDVQIWRGLQAGDRVLMLRVHDGNLYYVLQRDPVEDNGLINPPLSPEKGDENTDS